MRRKTYAERLKHERLLTALYAALACIGAGFLTAALFSLAASAADLSDGTFAVMSSAALCAACFAGSFTAAARKRKNGLKTGLLCGAVIFLAVLLTGAAAVKCFSAGGVFSKLMMISACSAVGGILGANRPRR